MKYKVVRLKEDLEVLKGQNLSQLAKKVGITRAYLSYLRNGERIATEALYNRIKEVVDKQ
jgi:transcriptional regulator with XRE-family HTH domain